MLWLALDGALGAFSAALVAGDGSIVRSEASAGNDALEQGLSVVDRVLGGTALRALEGLAVGTGPGSFTGLRIALSYAKSLAYASSRPLVGVSSYDALEPAAARPPYATFVHGRAGIACARLKTGTSELVRCGTYEAIADAIAAALESRLAAPFELVSYGASQGVSPALGERKIIVRASATDRELPAVAIAHRAMARPVPAALAHAVRADYGEAHYGERDRRPDGRATS